MAQVLIRDVDSRVMDKLKARARRNRRSLEAELRVIFEKAVEEPASDMLAEVERVRALFAGRTFDDSALRLPWEESHSAAPIRLETNNMLLTPLDCDPTTLERETGWSIKPEGACYGEHRCVPLPPTVYTPTGDINLQTFAQHLHMPLIH